MNTMIEIPSSEALSLISPRLTVLVNTVDEKGELNSSPYSWVFPLSSNPPLIGVAVGSKQKLTYINSKRKGEFVVCVVSVDFGQQAVNCEATHSPGDKLWEKNGLHAENSSKVSVPRIAEAKAVLECKVDRFVELKGDHIILVGRVLHAEAKGKGLDSIKPLLHDSGGRFRSVGNEILLERRR